jgi:hypothetical protein
MSNAIILYYLCPYCDEVNITQECNDCKYPVCQPIYAD